MTERVDIANIALSWLGEEEITSLDDDLDRARTMKINYAAARDSTLEAHEWSFAMKRFIPSPEATAPIFGPAYQFPIPADIIRVTSVHAEQRFSVTDQNEQIQWLMEENKIVCDEETIYCRGITRVTQEGRFSPLFVQAMAGQLAMLTAVSITGSAEMQSNMIVLYDNLLRQAKSRDGLQGRSRRIRNRTLQKAR